MNATEHCRENRTITIGCACDFCGAGGPVPDGVRVIAPLMLKDAQAITQSGGRTMSKDGYDFGGATVGSMPAAQYFAAMDAAFDERASARVDAAYDHAAAQLSQAWSDRGASAPSKAMTAEAAYQAHSAELSNAWRRG